MRSFQFLIFFVVLLAACHPNEQVPEKEEDLNAPTRLVPLNLKGGYEVNQFNQEEIETLIDNSGDTIQTGIRIPIQGEVISWDSIEAPRVVNCSPPVEKVDAQKNLHLVETDTFLVTIGKKPETNTTPPVIKNSQGKTIQTGVPIVVHPKKLKTKESEPIITSAPRLRDNATVNMHHLDIDQGLSASYIHSILEDRKGNIWIGNSVGGLSKYNGATITNYNNHDGFKNCLIFDILEDKKGNIWIATNHKGIIKYDGKDFYQYSEAEGVSSNKIIDIEDDASGNLWFATLGAGVIKLAGEEMTTYTVKEGLSKNQVYQCHVTKDGILWIGNVTNGIDVYDGNSFKHVLTSSVDPALDNEMIESFQEDTNGDLWFGTDTRGIYKLIRQPNAEGQMHLIRYSCNEGPFLTNIRAIIADKNNQIWVGSHGGAISKLIEPSENGGIVEILNYNEKQGMSNEYVLTMLQDRKDNLWIATDGGGLCILKENYIQHISSDDGVKSNYVISIIERKNGEKWFGTFDAGIAVYNGENYVQLTTDNGLFSNGIYAMAEDNAGNIWMSDYGQGISVFDGKTITIFNAKSGLSENNFRDILVDKKGNVWFLGSTTITKYTQPMNENELGFFTHFNSKGGFYVSELWSMIEDEDGSLWLATNKVGLVKFDEESIIYYTEKEGLNSNKLFSLAIDQQNNLWCGFYGAGVCKFNGDNFEYYSESDGLSSNIVTTLAVSKDNRIVVGTESGLNVIETNSTNQNSNFKTIIALNKNDGLKSVDFYQNSSLVDKNNIAWLGSGKNLVAFDLNKFKRAPTYPDAILKGIKINDQFIDYRNLSPDELKEIEFDQVVDFENYPSQLTVPYTKNHLTFEFVAIDWQAPHKIQYQYRIDGLDNNWSSITKKTSADYRNIPNGSYIFEVRAKTNGDEWGKTFQYHFTVLPPWYRTWWFQTLVGIVLILLLILLYRWRTAALRKRQKALENTVNLRTREVIAEKKLVEDQKLLIETKHKEITDSIKYAERIQRSFLASHELLNQKLTDYFVYYQPKDVVSGDFYWASELKNRDFAIAIADSTGHGVPGAIMSILNISSLEKAIETEVSPEAILNETRKIIVKRLEKDGSLEGGKDGMDCSLLVLNEHKTTLKIAAANSIVYVLREGELIELIGDKMPVGKHDKDHIDFSLKTFDLQKNDLIYALTDGFADQFGGKNGKKYMVKNLRNLLIKVSQYPIGEQKRHFMQAFETWRGKFDQLDDVCVVGFRV